MPVFELFSKRQKALRGECPDVYTYDALPQELRVQIINIWLRAIGDPADPFYGAHDAESSYKYIAETLCDARGVFSLPGGKPGINQTPQESLFNYFLHEADVEKALDAVQLAFQFIDGATRQRNYLYRPNASEIADEAINDLSARFKEHGVGYEYSNGEIIRVDSEVLHAEVVKPALRLLGEKKYSGAQDEFLKAHAFYRAGDAKETLNNCLNAFESVMKTICDRRKWPYPETAGAKDLLQVLFERELVPPYWQSSFTALRALLEGSVPTGRNKLSGHGQGAKTIRVPPYLVAYMLHMTAAAIVFLAEADSALS